MGGYAVLATLMAATGATASGLIGAAEDMTRPYPQQESATGSAPVTRDGYAAAAAPGDAGRFTSADAGRAARYAERGTHFEPTVAPADRLPPTGPVPAVQEPAFAAAVPPETTQVVRTVRTNQWCRKLHCTRTEAWERVDGTWRIVAQSSGAPAVFRSSIGPKGFAAPGLRREDDGRAPTGVFKIVVTFSTGDEAPGLMPWRKRLKTSIVSDKHNRFYNTWIENPKVGNGARASMRYGFWIDFNNPRLAPGVGPAPVPGVGSGIFYHTARKGQEWIPTFGCTQLGIASQMAWVVKWLDPARSPRVINNI